MKVLISFILSCVICISLAGLLMCVSYLISFDNYSKYKLVVRRGKVIKDFKNITKQIYKLDVLGYSLEKEINALNKEIKELEND